MIDQAIKIFSFLWDARIAILTFLAGVYIGFYIGGWAKGLEGDLKPTLKTVLNDIQIEEKQDEIRNNRPDRSGVVKQLRGGTF